MLNILGMQTKIAEMIIVNERKGHECYIIKTFQRSKAESEVLNQEMADLRDSLQYFMSNFPGGVKTYVF